MKNRVSVVIPTRNRPDSVVTAVASALGQTRPVEEVIVVVDGPDSLTVRALAALPDPRLHVIVLAESRGANNARNHGAALAKGEWIAFLDDDDEWAPHKVEAQVLAASGFDIVSSRFLAQSSRGASVWPKRVPEEGERFGDYLFARRSFFNGEAAIITSTLMVRKATMARMGFSTTLRRHQDADWVLRCTEMGARLHYLPQPLVKFNDDIGRTRISTSYDWRQSLDWIRTVRGLLGPRAYAGFLLTSVGAAASDKGEWRAFSLLLVEAFAKGRPTLLHLALYVGFWALPQKMRQRIRAFLTLRGQRTPALSLGQQGGALGAD